MRPEDRTKNLMTLLGWQGGTIHDACRVICVDTHEFLYGMADVGHLGPCDDFIRGYMDAVEIRSAQAMHGHGVQYWFGAISAVNNKFRIVE